MGIFYLVSGLSLFNSLRHVFADKEVLEMSEEARKYRSIEVYVWHSGVMPHLGPRPTRILSCHECKKRLYREKKNERDGACNGNVGN